MSLPDALDIGREALLVCLLIAGPILAAGLVIGVVVSLVQTVTQIQDQTLALIPKIVAMVLAAMFFVPWSMNRLIEYSRSLFGGE